MSALNSPVALRPIRSPLLLHFLDLHVLAEVGATMRSYSAAVRQEARLATRMAILASDQVLIPAASYFESSLCRTVLDELRPLFPTGRVWIVGRGANLQEFAEEKLTQYRPGSPQFKIYSELLEHTPAQHPPFRSRDRSASADLVRYWTALPERRRLAEMLGTDIPLPRDLETRWVEVPERLQEEAFIAHHVQPILAQNNPHPLMHNRLQSVINEGYFESFAHEYGAAVITEMVYLATRFAVRTGAVDLPYRALRDEFRIRGVLTSVLAAGAGELYTLQDDERVLLSLMSVLGEQEERTRSHPLLLDRALANPPDLGSLLKAVTRVKPGQQDATAYHRAVFAFLKAAFSATLVNGKIEQEILQGRKRVDILFDNAGEEGFFRYVTRHYRAPKVPIECKNYAGELSNPELDQLSGRLGRSMGQLGFLVHRRLTQRQKFVERCRDMFREKGEIILPVEDQDLRVIADAGVDPRWGQPQCEFLMSRLEELRLE